MASIVDQEYEIVDEPYLGYEIHLNKLSCGWRPLFQGHKAFTSFKELEAFYHKYNDEIVSFLPFVSILPAIASTFLYAGLLWVICDKFGNQVVRIILKVITAGFVGLLELSIVINRTIKK